MKLFAGRTSAVGTEEGGAIRPPDGIDSLQWWRQQIIRHVDQTPIGVYPMIPTTGPCGQVQWHVQWGCIDYDEGDEASLAHALNTVKVLDLAAGIKGWIEKSRSKGYHVWVFPQEAIEAIVMRRALLAAAQVVGAPMKEINPKQVELSDLKLGNYVRLPYPMAEEGIPENGRRTIQDNGDLLSIREFVAAAWVNRCTKAQLIEMGKRFVEPPKRERHQPQGNIDMDTPWSNRLDGFSYTMLYGNAKNGVEGGPYEGQDRSSWLWKLCNSMIERADLTTEEMITALTLGHNNYCPDKFGDRVEEEMERMVNKALDQHEG